MEYAKSGSRLEEVEMLTPQGEEPFPTVGWPVVKALARSLFRETGVLRGLGLMLRTNTWDMITNKPKWHPEYFEFGGEEEKGVYKKYFNLLTPTIILYNNLKRQYGEYLADEMFPIWPSQPNFLYIPSMAGCQKTERTSTNGDKLQQMLLATTPTSALNGYLRTRPNTECVGRSVSP